ncbi:hypothetical protein ABK040_012397 [Willaertia magna]
MKIKVKKVHLVANWTWKSPDEVCGICHWNLDGLSPDAASKFQFPGDDCPVVWGKCKHAFHLNCIAKWLETKQSEDQTCPMCRTQWEFL